MLTLLRRLGRSISRNGPRPEIFAGLADPDSLKRVERLIQRRQGRWRLLC